jgi:flagellar protein FlaG
MNVPGLQLQALQPLGPRAATTAPRPNAEAGAPDLQVRDRVTRSVTALAEAQSGGGVELPAKVELRMSLDREIDRVIARVVDSDTGEVVREVPPEDLVDLARAMKALMGTLLDRKV